jgi:hypothetical protein
MGDLGIDRCSWLHIDYLRASPFEEHRLGVIELAIIAPHFVVLVTNNTKAELSVKGISTSSLSSYVISIQEYLISSHSFGYYCSCGITCCRNWTWSAS